VLQTSGQGHDFGNFCSAPEPAEPAIAASGYQDFLVSCVEIKELEHREEQINLVLDACSIADLSEVMASYNFTFQFPFLAD